MLQIVRSSNSMSSRTLHVQPKPSSKCRESFVKVHGERPQRKDHERRLAGSVFTSHCSGTHHIEGRFGICPRSGSVIVWRINVQGIAGDSFALVTHESTESACCSTISIGNQRRFLKPPASKHVMPCVAHSNVDY